ncbi:MAG: LCP family protein [Candidatus Peribacteraceae bacterium]|nr:LCP family protein [Candidatus Peribacteraceae bacterium]
MFRKFSAFVRWGLVLIGIYVVFQILSGFYAIVSGGSFLDLVWFFAGNLHTDAEERTNFLLLGTGGENTDGGGGELTDSILVASYNHELNTLSMLSIPRDFWVESGNGIGMRVNKIYEYEKDRFGDEEEALESVAEIASAIVNLPIHYYAKIDFTAFIDLVDTVGGIKVIVEEPIDDPFYPCDDLIEFCPFSLAAGIQTLDGETALKYARSRKTTSDFDRAARQQKILEALREKAFENDILTSPSKLKDIWDIFNARVETNLRFREILMLGKIADEFDKQNLATIVLNDEPTFTGGILYAPNREDYGGAAVLLPNGDDFRRIHALTEILFDHPSAAIEQRTIEVLNGSGRGGIAERAAYALNRYGLNTARINNYPSEDLEKTTIYIYDEGSRETAELLRNFTGGEIEFGPVELRRRGFDISLVLGEDWREIE